MQPDFERPIYLTEGEREFLLSLLVKLPIQVTLETLPDNKAIGDLSRLVQKLNIGPPSETPAEG